MKDHLKYLGLLIGVISDGRLSFRMHFFMLAPKMEKTASHLERILPSLFGSGIKTMQLYANIVQSMMLYGAPVWAKYIKKKEIAVIAKLQRMIAIRATLAYRTIPRNLILVLAGMVPFYQKIIPKNFTAIISDKVYKRVRAHKRTGVTPAKSEVKQWRNRNERSPVILEQETVFR